MLSSFTLTLQRTYMTNFCRSLLLQSSPSTLPSTRDGPWEQSEHKRPCFSIQMDGPACFLLVQNQFSITRQNRFWTNKCFLQGLDSSILSETASSSINNAIHVWWCIYTYMLYYKSNWNRSKTSLTLPALKDCTTPFRTSNYRFVSEEKVIECRKDQWIAWTGIRLYWTLPSVTIC